MNQNLVTHHYTSYSEPDETIITSLLLVDTGGSVRLYIRKSTKEHSNTVKNDLKEVSVENVELDELNYNDFEELARRLKQFLETKSKPIYTFGVTELTGKFSKKEKERSFSGHNRWNDQETSFDSFGVSIGEYGIVFRSSDEEHDWELEIPAADEMKEGHRPNFNNIIELYNTFIDFFETEYSKEVEWLEDNERSEAEKTAIDKIEFIFERFSDISIPLQKRSRGRDPVSMKDEYDIQYLLHGLLKLYFDDVRDEQYLRQHAGLSPRIDFLLENQRIGIEVKRPTENKSTSTLRKELAEDIQCYRGNPSCETLLIFIYDPETTLVNAPEWERSLSEEDANLVTRTTVVQ